MEDSQRNERDQTVLVVFYLKENLTVIGCVSIVNYWFVDRSSQLKQRSFEVQIIIAWDALRVKC